MTLYYVELSLQEFAVRTLKSICLCGLFSVVDILAVQLESKLMDSVYVCKLILVNGHW